MAGIAAICAIALLLHYSEEGYLRRNGIRVTAFVTELPSGDDSCVRCPLEFSIDGERYYVKETLVGGYADREYFPGEAIDLYVDPGDMTHTIEVAAVQRNVHLGLFGMFIAGAFTLGWPIYELKRPIPR